jgi:hypothetical protein
MTNTYHPYVADIVGVILFLGIMLMFGVAFAVALLRPDHRLQNLLIPLIRRLAATVCLGVMAAPIDYFPDVYWAYDLAASAALCFYWWTFISEHLLAADAPARRQGLSTEAAEHTTEAEPHY